MPAPLSATDESEAHSRSDDPPPLLNVALRVLGIALHRDYLRPGRSPQARHRVYPQRLKRARSAIDFERLPSPSGGHQDAERAYLAGLSGLVRLSGAEEYRLAVRMRRGDTAARNALVQANLGLVVMFARRMQNSGLPLLELVAEGNIGLIAAARRFDPEFGFRFATYAKWYVLGAMRRALPRVLEAGAAIRAAETSATDAELEQPGVAPDEARPGAAMADPTANALALVDDAATAREPAGMDSAGDLPRSFAVWRIGDGAYDGTDAMWLDRDEAAPRRALQATASDADTDDLAIPEQEEPTSMAHASQRVAALRRAMESLAERERLVVSARFGLEEDHTRTLDALARQIGVSVERVRQIETAALRKLRQWLDAHGLSAASLL